jgi:hypothetical protein
MEVKQPLIGLDTTVTTTVRYVVVDTMSNQAVFDQVITTPYTAKLTDQFIGFERLRLANEGSVRENITKFIDMLRQSMGSAAPVAAIAITPPA